MTTGHPVLVAGGPFHPTFLYELIWDLGVAALVYFVDRRYVLGKGRAFALYVAGYTVGRFWVESLRIDNAHHFFGLRINDWVSILVFAGAVGYLLRVKGVQEHMRVDDDSTVTIVDPAGKPIPYYKPFTPLQRDGEGGNGTGTDQQWWSTTKRRSTEAWSRITTRWAGDVDDHDGDEPVGRPERPAGTK